MPQEFAPKEFALERLAGKGSLNEDREEICRISTNPSCRVNVTHPDCTALESPHAYCPNSENFFSEWHLKKTRIFSECWPCIPGELKLKHWHYMSEVFSEVDICNLKCFLALVLFLFLGFGLGFKFWWFFLMSFSVN